MKFMRFVVVVILFHAIAYSIATYPIFAQTPPSAAVMPLDPLYTDEGTPLNQQANSLSDTFPSDQKVTELNLKMEIDPKEIKFWNPDNNRSKSNPKALNTLPRFLGAIDPLTPKELNTYYALKENNKESDARISGVYGFCVISSNGTVQSNDFGYFVSDTIKEYPKMDVASRKLAPVLGDPKYSLTIGKNGEIPFETKTIVMNKNKPPCDINETGTTVSSDETPIADGFFAQLIQLFKRIISETASSEQKISGKMQPNTLNRWGKLATGDDTGTFTEGEYTDAEITNIQESKGFLPAFKPADADLNIPNDNGAVDLAEIKDMMIFKGISKLEKLEMNTVCAITSKDMPDRPSDCGLVTKRL